MIGIKEILHELTGNVVDCLLKNRNIRKQISTLPQVEQDTAPSNDNRTLPSVDDMLSYLERESSRRRIVEDKAKTNALAITLALSAMLAGVALVGNLADSGVNPLAACPRNTVGEWLGV